MTRHDVGYEAHVPTALWVSGVGLLAAATAFIAATGGGRLEVAWLVLSARDWTRPLVLLTILLAWRGVLVWRDEAPDRLHRALSLLAHSGFTGIVLFMAALAARSLIAVSGGLDSYGYVSAADALASGRLILAEPLTAWLPLDRPIDALAPLGWVPSVDGDAIVPRFPLGLPAVMALFQLAIGREGPFFVAPVLGAATVVLAYLLLHRAGGLLPAATGAAVIAAHPLFFTYSIQPMSDVPATFWVVLAAFLLYRPRPCAVLAGMAIGMAMLTRPPLGLVALAIAGVSTRVGRTSRRVSAVPILVLAGFAPSVVLFVALQATLYGSPAASGYGAAGNLFSVDVAARNVAVYARWLLTVNTPLLVVLLPAAWFIVERRLFMMGVLVCVAVALPYVFYTFPANDWEMLRFVLPGLIFLVMLAAHTAASLLERHLPATAAPLAAMLLCVTIAAASFRFLDGNGIFRLRQLESKYPAVGNWIAHNSGHEAVVLASLHSGSARYYSGRVTLRWDQIPADRLTAVVEAIQDRGRAVLLVLDGNTERDEFARRFGQPRGLRIEVVDRIRNVDVARVSRF